MKEFKKYHKIRTIGHQECKDIFINHDDKIYIQEKIDGGNFRFYINKNGQIIFGTRSTQLTSNEGEDTNVYKDFRRCLEFVRHQINKSSNIPSNKGLIFYGEACHKHTMYYDWDSMPLFLGFDIYDTEKEEYLDWAKANDIFNGLGLDTVPLLYEGTIKDMPHPDEKTVPITKYAPRSKPGLKAEGLVYKNYKSQYFSKLVRTEFKEDNALAFGGIPKYSEDDSGKIVAKYCTNARIEKQVFKLTDEDVKLELKMMEKLPRAISIDMFSEHWEDILYSRFRIDLGKVRKQITRRCLAVLKQIITNNEIYNKGKKK